MDTKTHQGKSRSPYKEGLDWAISSSAVRHYLSSRSYCSLIHYTHYIVHHAPAHYELEPLCPFSGPTSARRERRERRNSKFEFPFFFVKTIKNRTLICLLLWLRFLGFSFVHEFMTLSYLFCFVCCCRNHRNKSPFLYYVT